MKTMTLNNNQYELIKDYKNGFDLNAITERCNEVDYFDNYDYILGDWAYGKLRLKGLYDKNSQKYSESNAYDKVDNYIKNYCAYECRYFIIKKIVKKNSNS